MASPTKIKNVGYNYKPFEMKAKAHGNSPVDKNFGTKEVRFPSSLPYMSSAGGVGSSPAKGWFKNIAKKVGGFAKKAIGGPVGAALGIGKKLFGKDGGGGGNKLKEIESRISALENAESGGAPGEAESPFMQNPAQERTGDPLIDASRGFGGMGIPKDQVVKKGSWSGVGGGGAFGNLFSDIRLKEKIQRTGTSPSGIPIYEFNYIGDNNRYSGAMAQDLLSTDAVSMHESGYYTVNYNNIDVDMHLIN